MACTRSVHSEQENNTTEHVYFRKQTKYFFKNFRPFATPWTSLLALLLGFLFLSEVRANSRPIRPITALHSGLENLGF